MKPGDFEFYFGKALIFARLAHGSQVRKYTGEPYLNHCRDVAETVLAYDPHVAVIEAALLHDTIEDTSVTAHEIEWFFGKQVAELVLQVSDVSTPAHGNRAARKAIDRDHLARASPAAKTIKLADLISNTKSICRHDPGFARIYLAEKRLLLPVLTGGNPYLWDEAMGLLMAEEQRLLDRFATSP
jgi:(p)ppGpp synthase/HD superfamily hydrolase